MHQWSQRRRLGVVLGLNVSLIAGLVVVGLAAHAISVLAAAGDTAADSVALILGLLAVTIRDRRPGADAQRSPATTIVAILNGLILLAVTGVVVWEAAHRLARPATTVAGLPMLIVSAVTAAVLLVGAWVLGAEAADEDLHMRSVLLDTLADALAAAGVAAAGAVIAATGRFYWLDPVVALAISLIVAVAGLKLVADGAQQLRRAELRR